MKRQYLIFFTLLFSFFTQIVSGQKPCNNFDCAYKKAETFLKQAAYQKALDNLDSAEGYLTDTNTKEKEQIKQLRRRLFVAIEKEKEDAKRARDEAKRQTEIAKNALAQVEIEKKTVIAEKIKTDSLFKITEINKQIAQAALSTKQSLHSTYIKDSLGNRLYGFIDSNINVKIKFQYDEAEIFDYTHFAKVRKNLIYYLIDTIGNEYKLSTDLNGLDSNITALDLRGIKLDSIPNSVFLKKNIKVLLLGNNKLTYLTDNIQSLLNLTYLDLSNNKLINVPKVIERLPRLTSLNLEKNMITEFEQHKIKNLYTKYQINTQNQLAFEEMAKRYGYEVERSSFHDFYLAFQRNARGETLYGLIDTNIHIKIDFEYDEAFYFDETGYAKVKKNNIYYLMDTTGKLEYKLAIDINQLDKNITALYLTDRRLEEIPSIVFNHSQLKILKLDLKKLDSVPSEIGQLTNLKKLCITTTSRKEGVGVTEKLEKLLPNCKISINDWR